MVHSAFQPEQLHVQKMRQYGCRYPVGIKLRGERPSDARRRQPFLNVDIVIHKQVVVIDEVEVTHLAVDHEDRENHSEPDCQIGKRTVKPGFSSRNPRGPTWTVFPFG